jgi:hypothetical protein
MIGKCSRCGRECRLYSKGFCMGCYQSFRKWMKNPKNGDDKCKKKSV